jgi:hypothetical protein
MTMITLTFRRIVSAAIVAGAGAAASWAVRRYLESRKLRGERAQDRDMLHTWENEGGNIAPSPAYVSSPSPQ